MYRSNCGRLLKSYILSSSKKVVSAVYFLSFPHSRLIKCHSYSSLTFKTGIVDGSEEVKPCAHFKHANLLVYAKLHLSQFDKFPVCDLTADCYPVTRGSFNKITDADLIFFKNLLEDHRVITDEEELQGFNTDWLRIVRGSSSLLLKPKSTEEVSKILAYCNKRNLAVCPQGGNTGLVGGSVPVFDEIVVSTSLMNKVVNIDKLSGVLTCEAGCILESLDHRVSEFGLMMPLDLGAKGSCHIGGNVSTNAGGIRLLRYGNLHGSVLGLEAVLASGEVIDCLTSMKKDNTGYPLKNLFIGSEGTLGFVTKVSIHCPPKPLSTNLALLGLDSFDKVIKTFLESKVRLGEILSSCEFMDDVSMECVHQNLKLTSPIKEHKFYVLIETSGSNAAHDEEKLSSFLEFVMEEDIVNDGTVTSEPSKMYDIWALRERIAEALLHDGCAYKYDVSIPQLKFYDVVEQMQMRLAGKATRVCGYGHIGDGNLHFNVTSKTFNREVLNLIEPHFFEIIAQYKGSISAEHGLGFKKKDFIRYSRSNTSISLMKRLKTLMDPQGILNPYKVLPDV